MPTTSTYGKPSPRRSPLFPVPGACRCERIVGPRARLRAMSAMRIDKWLWAARFFKTRALAARACELGRIQSNGQRAKAARDVHAGDQLRVENEGGIFEVTVRELSEMRGPAAVAQKLYAESEASRAARQQAAAERKALHEWAPLPVGRPSKRDRRRIIRFRGD